MSDLGALVDQSLRYPRRLRLLFYDIETAPMLSFIWEPKTEYVPASNIVADDRFLLCWSAKWSDSQQVISARLSGKQAQAQDDAVLVTKLADLMRQADYVVAHNGNRFDWKRVNTRLLLNRLEPLGMVQMIDTLSIARTSFDLPYNNLNYLAGKLGFGEKIHTDFDLWRRCYYGDTKALKAMEAYNRQDVVLLEHVFHAMTPYAKTLPRLVDAAEWREELCPYCGSTERRTSRVPYRTKVNTYPKFSCTGCGRQYRGWSAVGAKKLGAIGL
jgi:hypothetical protein